MYATAATLVALASTASAAGIKGFNYGNTFTTGAAKYQPDFEAEFTVAQNLDGTSGFTSARLYTMVVSMT
jgi:glucan endo-1,3-beta-D-glucosidase